MKLAVARRILNKLRYFACIFSFVSPAQEKAALQGVGREDFHKYHMESLTDKQLSDFAGNSLSSCILTLSVFESCGYHTLSHLCLGRGFPLRSFSQLFSLLWLP